MTDSVPDKKPQQIIQNVIGDYSAVIGAGGTATVNVTNIYQAPNYPRPNYRSEIDYILSQTFIGREWVFEAVEDFIARHSCGYFRIVAALGLGKTAIAAQLVKHYRAIAYFFNKSSGLTRADQCLNYLIEQLIADYELGYDHLGGNPGQDSSFLSTLLEEISQQSNDSPLVIVIDAIDEADPTPPGHNWLHLPDRLPKGVFFVLTQRPGDFLLPDNQPFHITWDDPCHQTDIAAHLRRQAESPEITQILQDASPPISAEHFVEELQKASEGNFMYLHFVLEEISEGKFGYDLTQLLTQLPHGLEKYYEKFWDQMEKEAGDEGYNVWRQIYLPVISVLSAAREPVTAEQIATWSNMGIEDVYPALSKSRRGWRYFIRSQEQAGQETWSVIHRSFTDFLEKELRPTSELRKIHSSIAGWYLTTWGGLEAGLPELLRSSTEQAVTQHYHYGVSHLVSHLIKAERTDDFHALLQLDYVRENGQTVNLWYEAHRLFGQPGSYLADVEQAQRAAEQEGPDGISKLVRYALMHSSCVIHFSAEWLVALVSRGIWPPAQALKHIEDLADPEKQAKELAILAAKLPSVGGVEEGHLAAERAWELIPNIRSREEQAATFYTLIPSLPHHLIPQALELAREFKHPQVRAELLIALGARLDEEKRTILTQEILETIRQVEPIGYAMTTTPERQLLGWLSQPLTQIKLLLPRERETEAISMALAKARNISSIYDRTEALLSLLPRLPRRQIPDVLSEILSLAGESKNDLLIISALGTALDWLRLREEGWAQINDECRYTIRAIRNSKIRFLFALMRIFLVKVYPFASHLLRTLKGSERQIEKNHRGKFASGELNASFLGSTFYYPRPVNIKVAPCISLMLQLTSSLPTPVEQLTVILQTIEATRQIEDDVVQAFILAQLIIQLPEYPEFHREKHLAQAFAITEQLSDEYERAQTLALLSPVAQKIGRSDIIKTALSTATVLEDPYIKARILIYLLPYLDEQDRAFVLETAQQAAQEIGPGEGYYQAEVFLDLAESMSDLVDREALIEETMRLVQGLDPLDKAELLSRIARISPSEKAVEYFQAAWKNISSIENPSLRAQTLVGLSQLLSPEDRNNFLVSQWQQILPLQTQGQWSEQYSTPLLSAIKPLLLSVNDALSVRVGILSQLPADVLRQIVEMSPVGSKYNRLFYAGLVGTSLVQVGREADVWPNLFVKILPDLSVIKKEIILSKLEEWMVRQDLNQQAVTKIFLLPFVLSKKAITEAREFVSDIANAITRADALSVLSERYLTGRKREMVFPQILSAIAELSGEDTSRAEILLRLMPDLPPDLLDQAVDIVYSFQDDIAFAQAVSELIPRLPENRRASLATETLTRVLKIEEHYLRADLLIRLSRFQSEQEQPIVLQEALKAILLMKDDDSKNISLSEWSSSQLLFPFHGKSDFILGHSRIVTSASHPKSPNQVRGFTFARLQSFLKHSPGGLRGYLQVVLFERETGTVNQTVKKPLIKIEIGSLLATLPTPQPHIGIDSPLTILPSSRAVGSNWGKYVQVWISPLGRVRVQHYSRAELLSRLCPLLPAETLAGAIEMMEAIKDVRERAMALATLASHLSGSAAESLFDRAIELTDIVDELSHPTKVIKRAQCFRYLADKMVGDRRTAMQSKALEAVQLVEDQDKRLIILAKLAADLPSTLRTSAWDVIHPNLDEWASTLKVGILVALVPLWPHIPQDISYQLISKALQTLAHRPRPALLQGLDALIPIIGQQQDTKAADEIADAVLDTLKWWP